MIGPLLAYIYKKCVLAGWSSRSTRLPLLTLRVNYLIKQNATAQISAAPRLWLVLHSGRRVWQTRGSRCRTLKFDSNAAPQAPPTCGQCVGTAWWLPCQACGVAMFLFWTACHVHIRTLIGAHALDRACRRSVLVLMPCYACHRTCLSTLTSTGRYLARYLACMYACMGSILCGYIYVLTYLST